MSENINEPLVNIRGERVALGPLRADLLDTYERWNNSFGTMRTQGDLPGPRSRPRTAAWYERIAGATGSFWYLIYELETWEPIGFTWLSDVNHLHRTAGFAISIGEEWARGKGFGTETTRLMLDFGFTALGLHNISLEVYSHNVAGIRAYEKAGFREYGRRHECFYVGGQFVDVVLMECLSTGFESPVLSTIFTADP